MGGIGTIGVIVGAEIPMFLGSMIMGPLGGLVIKYVDKALEKRIPAGFEMVINNFSLGDRKSTRLNSSHVSISYAVFCLKKKKAKITGLTRQQLNNKKSSKE